MTGREMRGVSRRRLLVGLSAAVAAAGAGTPWLANRVTHRAGHPASDTAAGGPGLRPERHLALPWLPAGYRAWAYALDVDRESITAGPDPAAQVDQNLLVQVTAYRPGTAPAPDSGDQSGTGWRQGTGADRVAGRPTEWIGLESGRTSADIRLRWQYADDSWAVLESSGQAGQDNLATALRVATATRFGPALRVRLPVRAPALPGDLRLQAVDGHDPGPPDQWAFTLTYGHTRRPLDSNAPYPCLIIDVQAMNDSLRSVLNDPTMGPTTTIDGHPARRDLQRQAGDGYQDQLQLWNVNGLKVGVSVVGQQTRDLLGADSVAVYQRLDLLPDRSTWT
ncbi:MAG: hypothetical protein V7603_4563 [Micromonosporaceae bacterium]